MVHRIDDDPRRRKRASPWLWLLLIPYPALRWVPGYDAVEPRFLGVPCFYTYQMAFVVITSIITALVYFITD